MLLPVGPYGLEAFGRFTPFMSCRLFTTTNVRNHYLDLHQPLRYVLHKIILSQNILFIFLPTRKNNMNDQNTDNIDRLAAVSYSDVIAFRWKRLGLEPRGRVFPAKGVL